jgi:hypothetical protein
MLAHQSLRNSRFPQSDALLHRFDADGNPVDFTLYLLYLKMLSTVKEFTETAAPFFEPGAADDS